ncbi:hypothetical protein BWD10_04670 [Neisseria zoodegmatis]|uniref:SH3b domain-containing protein n=1 Tax=Neisseria zoodegmatis TaxID=326523 RepID=A0ABX3WEP9_9NEIS|nr:hypothetical protein BWD10_04670 [Neisseria zoodegmatis]
MASWGKSLDADNNKKILYFDFIPENQSISNGNEISILTKKQDQQNILKTFSTIPSGFYSYQEGIATQPVSITLSNIGQETFCDSKYYYADFVKLRKIKHTKITKIPKAKCLDAYLRDDIYLIKSTDEKGVNLREKPAGNAKVLKILADNKLVKKLKTFPNGWFYVALLNDDGSDMKQNVHGYIHKSQLKLLD